MDIGAIGIDRGPQGVGSWVIGASTGIGGDATDGDGAKAGA